MKLATEKQINLIKNLINKKEDSEEIENILNETYQNYVDEEGFSKWGYLMDANLASELIEKLSVLNDKKIRPATDKQSAFLEAKFKKACKGKNKKAKTILEKYNLLDPVRIACVDFNTASKAISEFYE